MTIEISATNASPLTIMTGSSRGLGLALALQLGEAGHRLICMARTTTPALGRLEREGQLEQWQLDLSQPEKVATQLRAWLDRQNPQDFASATLINNAALLPPVMPLSEAAPDDQVQAIRVGLEAPILLTMAFIQGTRQWPMMRKVLNISSGLGRHPMASQATYCAVKAGLDNFTRSLALDEAHKEAGVRVCALAPGVVDTDMQVQMRNTDPALFPDHNRFANLKTQNLLLSPSDAAARIIAFMARPNFGVNPIADIRDEPLQPGVVR